MLKLKRYKEGVWIEYPASKDVSFKIRPSQLTDTLAIRNRLRKKIVVPDLPDEKSARQRPNIIADDVDEGAFAWAVFDLMLEDWKGIELDLEEGEKEPSRDEVKKAIFNNADLTEFITVKANELARFEKEKLDEEIKN